jgi:hypothetical protein
MARTLVLLARVFVSFAMMVFAISTCAAQPLPLQYRFIAGKTYVYKHVVDHRAMEGDSESNDWPFSISFVHTVVMRVEVERVDDSGNGTLLCTVLDQRYTKPGEGDASAEAQLEFSRTMPEPKAGRHATITISHTLYDVTQKFRVTLSNTWTYLSGETLQISQSEKDYTEGLKNPNSSGIPWNTDQRLAGEIAAYFRPLPAAAGKSIGMEWKDTSITEQKQISTGTRKQTTVRSIPTTTTRTCRLLADVNADTVPCMVLEETTRSNTQENGTQERGWEEQRNRRTHFRASDGVLLGYESRIEYWPATLNENERRDSAVRATGSSRLTLLREE